MKDDQSGFTLIEALIAFIILSIGLMATVKMMTNIDVSGQISRQRMQALNYATNKLEEMRAAGVCSALPPTIQNEMTQATTQYTLQVSCVGNTATITVTWNDSRGGQALVGGADNQVVLASQL